MLRGITFAFGHSIKPFRGPETSKNRPQPAQLVAITSRVDVNLFLANRQMKLFDFTVSGCQGRCFRTLLGQRPIRFRPVMLHRFFWLSHELQSYHETEE